MSTHLLVPVELSERAWTPNLLAELYECPARLASLLALQPQHTPRPGVVSVPRTIGRFDEIEC